MKMRRKKIFCSLLAASMILAMTACAGGSTDQNLDQQNAVNPSTSEAVSNQDQMDDANKNPSVQTRVITDMLGREVEIPAVVNTIVPICDVPILTSYLGLTEKIVGIEECEISTKPIRVYAYGHAEQWAALPNVGTSSGGSAFYPEQIMQANPDVVITSNPAEVADDIQRQTGIPVVCVTPGKPFSENYEQALLMVADICGVEERGRELTTYINDNLADLAKRVAGLDDAQKPTVLGGAATFKGGHSIDGVYVIYPAFDVLDINNVAAGAAGTAKQSGLLVDKEQILQWDPEIIFFDASNMELVRTDYAEDAEFFNQLQAVQNGKLYQMPNYNSHVYNVEITLLNAYYIGSLVYPDRFADVDFQEKAREVFDMFVGNPDYLSILAGDGYGYGQVDLGV